MLEMEQVPTDAYFLINITIQGHMHLNYTKCYEIQDNVGLVLGVQNLARIEYEGTQI